MADITERAYAAGLFDGEGCVQLYMRQGYKTKNCLKTALSISGVDFRPLYWLQDRWGGSFSVATPKDRRPLARWIVWSDEAHRFALDVQPFLIVKREQVDLWLQARALLRAPGTSRVLGPLSDEEVTQRLFLVDRVKELKRVG